MLGALSGGGREGEDRIYSENCARGAGAVGEGLMDTAYFLLDKTYQAADRIQLLWKFLCI